MMLRLVTMMHVVKSVRFLIFKCVELLGFPLPQDYPSGMCVMKEEKNGCNYFFFTFLYLRINWLGEKPGANEGQYLFSYLAFGRLLLRDTNPRVTVTM